MSRRTQFFAALVSSVLVISSCGSGNSSAMVEVGPNGEVKGVFSVDPGMCGSFGPESGSWFRMIEPGGNALQGPFVTNFDSMCPDQAYSLLSPGTTGFRAGKFQKHPRPGFDAATNGLANEIIGPTRFYSVNFALSSEDISPLTGKSLPPPKFMVVDESGNEDSDDWTLMASLESLYIAWNGEYVEQGAPHPEGFVGGTTSPRGSINMKTGRYNLNWKSQINGGAFDGYIGEWHLEGIFSPGDPVEK
jgi:hypothetical protein